MAPGYRSGEFLVKASGDSLRVRAPGFELVRPLRCRVDPASIKTSYKNGVLCVRLSKAF
jgi:HSP20 family molecular chaperone IbpA